MDRALTFEQEHEEFREAFGAFLDAEAVPFYGEWSKKHEIPHSFYKKMADRGFMATWIDKKYGGQGKADDYRYVVIKAEEYSKRGLNGIFTRLSGDVVAPYINEDGNEAQRAKWLPKIAAGEVLMAVCMTEPEHGSDLAHIETSCEDKGDHYLVNGVKTFISNGMTADLYVVAVVTDPHADKPHRGISLVLVEADREGVSREYIERIGLHAQDTALVTFKDVKIPKDNLIGEQNRGFYILMKHLEAERIMAAYGSLGTVQHTLELTEKYVKERQIFGKPVSAFQNVQFKLAKLEVEYHLALNYLDRVLVEYMNHAENINTDCSMIKYYTSELAFRAADECVQMFGGYGICEDYEISRQFVDARLMRFMGGTSETQLGVIAGSFGIK